MTIPKFRAWFKREQRMFLISDLDTRNQVVLDNSYNIYPFNEIELMQSTGLFDENGKEIFDGDILHTPDNELAKVFWNDDLAGWFVDFIYETAELSEVADIQSNRSICAIAGNIYENPEFLEEVK